MKWLTRDVLLISLSAFFADAGYQALIAGFPLFLVLYLLAVGFLYMIGPLFAYSFSAVLAVAAGIVLLGSRSAKAGWRHT
jgi:hypothetical protein